ncbi:MAG: hypothetical protein ACOH1X_08745 [Kaistella sp.]
MKKIVLSAVFVITGSFAMAQQGAMMQNRTPEQMEQRRADNMKQMQANLNLTPAQVAQINTLHDKRMAERKQNMPLMQAQRTAKIQAMQEKRTQHAAEMRKILTPDQYQKWEATRKDRMQNNSKNMQNRPMKRMPASN